MAGPKRGRRGDVRTEEGEKSIAVAYILRSLSLAAIRTQSYSLLGRLECIWGEEQLSLLRHLLEMGQGEKGCSRKPTTRI